MKNYNRSITILDAKTPKKPPPEKPKPSPKPTPIHNVGEATKGQGESKKKK